MFNVKKMNTVFNTDRFWNLLKREAIISRKQYLFIICGITAFYAIAAFLEYYYGSDLKKLLPFIYLTLIVCAPFFDKSQDESHTHFYFSLPVSTFERFLTLWIKSVIVMPVIILGTSVILDTIFSPLVSLSSYTILLFDSWSFYYWLFAIQSVFLFGYVYFRKRAFVKTLLSIAGLFVIIIMISKIMTQFYPEVYHIKNTMGSFQISDYLGFPTEMVSNGNRSISMVMPLAFDIAKGILIAIFPLGLWILTYFRLRETEI